LTDLDLSPRPQPAPPSRARRLRNLALVGAVAAALGFVLVQALTNARVFFYNVDEAVAQQQDLGDRTFRMQGVVVTHPARDPDGAYRFAISHGDAQASVHHVGAEPTDLFEVGIPVVVEGRWEGGEFRSQQILVKHSEEYIAENPDHLDYDGDGVADYGEPGAPSPAGASPETVRAQG
jgi:cytochrome c-type biogenesis protein CcmE